MDRDERLLEKLGYHQELLRRLSAFSNYAISFSIICILAGGVTSFHVGLCSVGGAAFGLGWPIVAGFALMLAATMGQIASSFPTAGGIYHWAAILGGRGWGWATAWLNLLGLVAALAAVDLGCWLFILRFTAPLVGVDPSRWSATTSFVVNLVAMIVLLGTQGVVNHLGIKLTAKLIDFSGWWILAVSVVLTALMLALAPGWHFDRLWTVVNFSGAAGGNVWPETKDLVVLFTLSFLVPAYTLTGYDASAHAAEETVNAAENVPKGIVRSVLMSGIAGWVLLSAIVVSIPDLPAAAAKGTESFYVGLAQVLPPWLALTIYVAIAVANYLCGLSIITSTSRAAYAFARDEGLPWSPVLKRVSPKYRTPVPAIWATCGAALAFTLYTPVYETMAAVCALYLNLSYIIPTVLGLRAYGRTWKSMGPWHLGRAFRPLAVVSTAGCLALIVVGCQPPNEKTGIILGSSILFLSAFWWLRERAQFIGPKIAMADFAEEG